MKTDIQKRIGKNIRSLRIAYEETQEELSEAIGYVSKNAISNYENGIREPDQDTLAAIAKHYLISIEELVTCDLSNMDKFTVTPDDFWNNIDIFLPVACSNAALKNEHFKNAYIIHQDCFKELKKSNMGKIKNLAACFDEYTEACDDSNSMAESTANFISLWFLLLMLMRNASIIIKDRPAVLMQITSKNAKLKQTLENTDLSFLTKLMDEIYDLEINDLLTECIAIVKKSKEWYELADYYMALQFIWNLSDNELNFGINLRMGAEMMCAFAKTENPYASRLISLMQS